MIQPRSTVLIGSPLHAIVCLITFACTVCKVSPNSESIRLHQSFTHNKAHCGLGGSDGGVLSLGFCARACCTYRPAPAWAGQYYATGRCLWEGVKVKDCSVHSAGTCSEGLWDRWRPSCPRPASGRCSPRGHIALLSLSPHSNIAVRLRRLYKAPARFTSVNSKGLKKYHEIYIIGCSLTILFTSDRSFMFNPFRQQENV